VVAQRAVSEVGVEGGEAFCEGLVLVLEQLDDVQVLVELGFPLGLHLIQAVVELGLHFLKAILPLGVQLLETVLLI